MIVKKKIEKNIIIADIINTIKNHRTKWMTLDLGIIDPKDKSNLTNSVHMVSTKISIETAKSTLEKV